MHLQVSKLIYQRSTGNELLDFIKVQEPAQLKELTQHISTPVIEAMNTFVERLIGSEERRVEARNPELASTFYTLIIVGYYLRQLEVFSSESRILAPSMIIETLSSLPLLDFKRLACLSCL